MKIKCSSCLKWRNAANFYPYNRAGWEGKFHKRCKWCEDRHITNLSKWRKYTLEYYRYGKAIIAEKHHLYYLENKDHILEKQKAWRLKNLDRARAYSRWYRQKRQDEAQQAIIETPEPLKPLFAPLPFSVKKQILEGNRNENLSSNEKRMFKLNGFFCVKCGLEKSTEDRVDTEVDIPNKEWRGHIPSALISYCKPCYIEELNS